MPAGLAEEMRDREGKTQTDSPLRMCSESLALASFPTAQVYFPESAAAAVAR